MLRSAIDELKLIIAQAFLEMNFIELAVVDALWHLSEFKAYVAYIL